MWLTGRDVVHGTLSGPAATVISGKQHRKNPVYENINELPMSSIQEFHQVIVVHQEDEARVLPQSTRKVIDP